ncbi:MAG: hypothetical protein M1282_09940 [Chloroflexi bacterium]|nr:hypothetical protein [Chloroflexota bacterium]
MAEIGSASANQILTRKEPPNLYNVVPLVLKDAELRDFLVENSFAKDETLRYNCVRVLSRALAQHPELFYPYWDRFAKMIDSPNGFHRSAAAQSIARLASVDEDCRLDLIFNHYLGLLDESKVMASHYFLETLGLIYRARPDFRRKIMTCLLSIDDPSHPLERRDLLKADIISIFDQLFEILPASDQKKAAAFDKAQLECESSKTRKAAKEFQKKHCQESHVQTR